MLRFFWPHFSSLYLGLTVSHNLCLFSANLCSCFALSVCFFVVLSLCESACVGHFSVIVLYCSFCHLFSREIFWLLLCPSASTLFLHRYIWRVPDIHLFPAPNVDRCHSGWSSSHLMLCGMLLSAFMLLSEFYRSLFLLLRCPCFPVAGRTVVWGVQSDSSHCVRSRSCGASHLTRRQCSCWFLLSNI